MLFDFNLILKLQSVVTLWPTPTRGYLRAGSTEARGTLKASETDLADWEQADAKRVAGRCESVYA